jgi:hypothetical protein
VRRRGECDMDDQDSTLPSFTAFNFASHQVLAEYTSSNPDGRYRVTSSPEVLAYEISFLAAQAQSRSRSSL